MSIEFKGNVFSQQDFLLKQKPIIKVTIEDSLIKALQEVIDKVLGHIKLNDDDIESVLKVVNGREMKD